MEYRFIDNTDRKVVLQEKIRKLEAEHLGITNDAPIAAFGVIHNDDETLEEAQERALVERKAEIESELESLYSEFDALDDKV